MITLGGGQNAKLFQPHYNCHFNVQMVPSGGGVFNPTAHLLSGQITGSMDQACVRAVLTFARGTGTDNLSPLVTGTTWNANGPLMYPGSFISVEVCLTDPGVAPSLFSAVFIGRVDGVDLGGDTVVIRCRDSGAWMLDRWIKVEKPYGPLPIEDVIAAILTDNGFAAGTHLITEGTPSFTINQYMQEPGSVLEAVRLVAQQRGWDLRYFVSRGKLRFYDPDRERVSVDATITDSEYIKIDRLDLDDADVRNQVRVWYAQETGQMASVYVEDAASMLQHGQKFTQIPMSRSKNLTDLTAATTFANFALTDMKDPLADQQVTLPIFPIVELNDFYQYSANADYYSADQKWAIAGYTHSFSLAGGTTTFQTRGKPMAAFRDYRRGVLGNRAVSVDLPPEGTYLDGLVFPEGYIWMKTDDISIP